MEVKYYKYDPSLAAAVIFILGFSVSSLMHVYQIWKTKTWFFIPFLIGSLCTYFDTPSHPSNHNIEVLRRLCTDTSIDIVETVGFIGRAIGAKQSPDWTFGPYVMQSLLLLLGPTCYAASIYMILGRLIRLLGAEKYSLIRPSWLTKFFLFGDVLSIALQGMGT